MAFARIAAPTGGLVLCLGLLLPGARGDDVGIRAPAGFHVQLFAGDDLAHDIYSMTLDAQGRVVVSGRDYVKILHDDDSDGRAERASLFSSIPASGAHGMLFLGNDLLCTGDNSLVLLRDADGDGQADGPPEKWAALRNPEHGANGLVRGPDGWIYLICGNDAGVTATLAKTAASPVKQPMSGAVVRFSPDGQRSEVVAHGFRNPYDLDFNAAGSLFTVDADGERDNHLPWYAPTRLFDIAQGMHHGWVLNGWQRSWSRPAYFPDNVPRLVELGRGSPTGLIVYRHTQFPPRYRGSVLSCCWTFGRVYHLPLSPAGSTYTAPAKPDVFLETTGELGFAPVDLAVGRQGELYVAIGGRRTRGSVFRVTYEGGAAKGTGSKTPEEDLAAVLAAPQPLATWSRAQWEPRARQLGREKFIAALGTKSHSLHERLRAVEIITDLFDGLEVDEARAVNKSAEPELAARVLWSLGRRSTRQEALKLIVAATRDARPIVQRAAYEALGSWDDSSGPSAVFIDQANWSGGFVSPDRRVQAAALVADARRDIEIPGTAATDLWRLHFRGRLSPSYFAAAAEAFFTAKGEHDRLSAVRLMELCLGDINTAPMNSDVYAGYTLNSPPEIVAAEARQWSERLATGFPARDNNLNLELARLLATLGTADPSLIGRITDRCTANTPPQQDLHYLICLSRLPGERSAAATERTALALARLQLKMQQQELFVSRNWPLRVGEAVAELYEHDFKLAAAVVACPDFKLPIQALLARPMPAEQQQAAARKLIRAAQESAGQARGTEDLVTIVAGLPDDEAFGALRSAWDDYSLRDAIIAILRRAPQEVDRGRFVESLGAVQASTVETAAAALEKLGGAPQPEELVAAFAALKQACLTPEQRNLRQSLVKLLITWTQQNITVDDPGKGEVAALYRPWFDWLAQAHPDAAARLESRGSVDVAAWQERLPLIESLENDIARGRVVFERKACLKCHAGTSPLGPDLAGAATRLSRADLLAAIVDPSKDVSPLYQTTQVVTASGRVVTGLIMYESPDATLVQVDPDNTVRVAGDEIVAMRKSRVSLMPNGLLNDVTNQEIADLLAYLRTIEPKKP
jgi:putative membrane-bound dehydrogenase-like protein